LLSASSKSMGPGCTQAFAVVSLSWVFASAIGGVTLPSERDGLQLHRCLFRAMSGFTTTGASILTDIHPIQGAYSSGRSHPWLGGLGIIVLSLAILPFLGVGGMQLYKAEVPGPVPGEDHSRVRQTALLLWGVYVLLSAIQVGALMLGGWTSLNR
jgi:trk system potassium uptake protein TrkH